VETILDVGNSHVDTVVLKKATCARAGLRIVRWQNHFDVAEGLGGSKLYGRSAPQQGVATTAVQDETGTASLFPDKEYPSVCLGAQCPGEHMTMLRQMKELDIAPPRERRVPVGPRQFGGDIGLIQQHALARSFQVLETRFGQNALDTRCQLNASGKRDLVRQEGSHVTVGHAVRVDGLSFEQLAESCLWSWRIKIGMPCGVQIPDPSAHLVVHGRRRCDL
jgi:hypothetical protein